MHVYHVMHSNGVSLVTVSDVNQCVHEGGKILCLYKMCQYEILIDKFKELQPVLTWPSSIESTHCIEKLLLKQR